MTTLDPHVSGAGPRVVGHPVDGYAEAEPGVFAAAGSWVTSTDHKQIGRLMAISALIAGVAVAALGALIGFDRADSTKALVDEGAIPQLFSAYRVGLVMCVVLPLLLGVALAVVPLQVGARSVAFPRLAQAGFWAWLLGTVLVIVSIAANGGPGGGDRRMVSLFQSGQIVLALGLLAVVAAVATTVLTTRAPGMNLRRVPPFTWSVLVFCLGLLLILPALIGVLAYTWIDYRHGRQGFGGTRALGSWLGFAYSQPATFVYAIPAFGLALETFATATRRRLPLRGIGFIGIGLLGTAALGAITRTTFGLERNIFRGSFSNFLRDAVPFLLFTVLPVLGALIVLAVGLFAFVGKMPQLISPLLFGVFGAGLAFLGIAGTIVAGIGDAQLGGTVYEESMWLFVCYGTLIAALGALVYWTPKLAGGRADDRKVLPGALLGALGVALAAGPLVIAGFAKQPGMAMAFDYSGPQNLWNLLSGIGHVLVAFSVAAVLILHLASTTRDGGADDPWDAQTLEWATPSPAPEDNFAAVHSVMSPEPLLDLKPGGQS